MSILIHKTKIVIKDLSMYYTAVLSNSVFIRKRKQLIKLHAASIKPWRPSEVGLLPH